MEEIIALSDTYISRINLSFQRSKMKEISWDNQLIGLKGARGTGKTTLLLQYLKSHPLPLRQKLYLSLDDLYFTSHSLLDFVSRFYKNGGKLVVLDEVHKYANWSLEIKNLYDRYPDLQLIFTGSSILDITKKEGDLSRRALYFSIQGLSYREYLEYEHGLVFPKIDLPFLLSSQFSYNDFFTENFRPYQFFNDYLIQGYYPFKKANRSDYQVQLRQLTRSIVEYDMAEIKGFDVRQARKLLQLLYIIAQQVPFKPNLSQLAAKTQIHRNSLNNYIFYLEEACLISVLHHANFSVSAIQKPEKIFLENTNLLHALSEEVPNTGTMREVFINNQLREKHRINQSKTADFLVDNKYTLEVGGKSKKAKQIAGTENVWLVRDDLERPVGNNIPLWLFGFLY